MRRLPLLLAAALAGPVGAQPTPTTGELHVNTYTINVQNSPAVAGLTGGDFVVVWESEGQDGSLYGIYGQRFDGVGNRVGEEFRVNATTAFNQEDPAVAALSGGGFVVAWSSAPADNADADVYVRRFDAAGAPLGGDVLVNTTAPNDQSAPAVAALAADAFVVTWQSEGGPGGGVAIYTRRFDGAGAPAGGETLVSASTSFDQTGPAVGGLTDGGYVVAWTSASGSLTDIRAQRYSAAGAPVGDAFTVNTHLPNNQAQPAVDGLAGGGFVVAWASLVQDLNGWGTYAQRYDAAGAPAGAEFRVNTGATVNNQFLPSVAGLASGAFVITWASNLQDGDDYGIYARRYTGAGAADGPEFRVNTTTENVQTEPSVGALAGGGFAVAWQSLGQEEEYGVYGRVYEGVPSAGEAGPGVAAALRGPAPNPARGGEARLTLDLARPARVALEVYDALGRRLHHAPPVALASGAAHALPLPALPPGAYLYRVRVDDGGADARAFSGVFTVAR